MLLAAPLGWSQADSLFHKATEAYNEGAYEEAVGYYEAILGDNRHSAALYYNLGNS